MTLSYLPARSSRPGTASLGLDLTGLGVRETGPLFADLPVAKADLGRLASYTRAAHGSGIDFVALGAGFRARSDEAVRPDAWLDPVVVARRLRPHAGAGLVASVPVPADVRSVAGELAEARSAAGAWTGLQLSADTDAVAGTVEEIHGAFAAARAAQPRVVVAAESEAALEAAAGLADVVRVRETDLAWAREVRYAARAAARAAGREDVRVLVDLRVVVAPDRTSAEARAELVADIDGPDAHWAGALAAVGTAADVADLVQTWVAAGAADGFVVLPGSVPADIRALLREVVPELRGRGLLAARPSARPAAVSVA